MNTTLKPGQRFPVDTFQLPEGGTVTLDSLLTKKRGLMLIAYRGVQCAYCKEQLEAIEESFAELDQRDFAALAVSTDTPERAQRTESDLSLTRLTLACGFDTDAARSCGLYLSEARKDSEMPVLCEPGVFLIGADRRLLAAWTGSFAFPRPPFSEIIRAIDFMGTMDPGLPLRGSA